MEELLLEPYDEPVDIHIVLQYRESEDPNTPSDCTPETSTAVKLLKEEMNINLIYDWIVNADQYEQKFGAELAAGNLPDVFMVNPNNFNALRRITFPVGIFSSCVSGTLISYVCFVSAIILAVARVNKLLYFVSVIPLTNNCPSATPSPTFT